MKKRSETDLQFRARINAAQKARLGNFNALLYTKIGPAGVLLRRGSGLLR